MNSHKTVLRYRVVATLLALLLLAAPAMGQIFKLTPEQLAQYTSKNPYERFPDGRPKVPDALLDKVRGLSCEEILGIAGRGYPNQYADGFELLHPGKKLVGRAVTVQLMWARADVREALAAEWQAKGGGKPLSNQTVIDMLQPGDVLVADLGGDVSAGGLIGDNLAYYIWKTTGAGFVIDGAIRDLEGIANFDMAGYFRAATPDWTKGMMVTGINVPVRIGKATVMPGDVVFGDREGVYFIPPHLVQDIVDEADITHIHDVWTKLKFDEGKYKSSDIYSRPSDPALQKEYEEYLRKQLGPEAYERYQKRRAAGSR